MCRLRDDLRELGGWADLPFFALNLPDIETALAEDAREILPPAHQRFAALELCPPDETRVVILGQDPYPTPGRAHGLAFSVPQGVSLPASLRNIFREMTDDLGHAPDNGDLTPWVRQGVLLLNTALTVPVGERGGHADLGWSVLTRQVLGQLNDRPRAFMLWGNPARWYRRFIVGEHLIVESSHPSPLSAWRGFFGSRPFSRVNAWLADRGEPPIRWV